MPSTLDQLSERRAEREANAMREFDELVGRMSRVEDVDDAEVERIVAAAGRTFDNLCEAVKTTWARQSHASVLEEEAALRAELGTTHDRAQELQTAAEKLADEARQARQAARQRADAINRQLSKLAASKRKLVETAPPAARQALMDAQATFIEVHARLIAARNRHGELARQIAVARADLEHLHSIPFERRGVNHDRCIANTEQPLRRLQSELADVEKQLAQLEPEDAAARQALTAAAQIVFATN